MAAMELVGGTTLVLTTSLTAVQQWRRELLDKTMLRPGDIAEYTGERKDTGPVTLTTYQILTWRPDFVRPRTCRRAGGWGSPQPWCGKTAAKRTCSPSSDPTASTSHGRTWS